MISQMAGYTGYAGARVLRPEVPSTDGVDTQTRANAAGAAADDGGRGATRTAPVTAGDASGFGTAARKQVIASQDPKLAQSTDNGGASGDLTDEERAVVDKLQSRDTEVRRHEEAHASVGGVYAGRPTYTYQTGPDGQRYAIGGEVRIDIAPIPDDPEATIDKMRVVKAAALAPAEPSSADRRVAAIADAQRLAAQADLSNQRQAELSESLEGVSNDRGVATEQFSTIVRAVGPDQQEPAFDVRISDGSGGPPGASNVLDIRGTNLSISRDPLDLVA